VLICNSLEEPFRTTVVIAMCLGLPVSEILALKWADFDFEDGTLIDHARDSARKNRTGEDGIQRGRDASGSCFR
jgi:integrase